LRLRPFGYRRADVDQALDTRDSDIAELRQDIAALWMAFAQHDRIIRAATSGGSGAPDPPDPARDAAGPLPPESVHEARAAAVPEPEPSPDALAATEDVESIGRQLTDLDEVLAAIEMATQTLERTYAEEIAAGSDVPPQANGPEDAGAGKPGST